MKKFARLRLAIRNKYKTQANFARAAGYGQMSLSDRLTGRLCWTVPEAVAACKLLDLDPQDNLYKLFYESEQES